MPGYPCCCNSLPPVLSCGQCTTGTPRYFDVTVPRSWYERRTVGTLLFEVAAGTYRCVQVSNCFWKVHVGSYLSNSSGGACPGLSPQTVDVYVAALIEASGLGGIRITFGVWEERPGSSAWAFRMFIGLVELGTGVNCKAIDADYITAGDFYTTGEFCVEGGASDGGHEAGTANALAIP